MTGLATAPSISAQAFDRFRALIYREAGIALADSKRALLVGRLGRRLRELSLASFDDYYQHVVAAGEAELERLLNAVCTNETQFFREPRQLELLAGSACDAWIAEADAGRRPRRIRVWSAACSSGEEPYSIAMLLHDRLGRLGWTIEIVASDLSTAALARARAATWKEERIAPVPERLRRAYLLRGTGSEAGLIGIGPVLKSLVRFQRINLTALPTGLAAFDAIFCRNVLMYFDTASREAAVNGLLRHAMPGALLFLGHAESLLGSGRKLTAVMPSVYRVTGAA